MDGCRSKIVGAVDEGFGTNQGYSLWGNLAITAYGISIRQWASYQRVSTVTE
jgi:hypothetical protein